MREGRRKNELGGWRENKVGGRVREKGWRANEVGGRREEERRKDERRRTKRKRIGNGRRKEIRRGKTKKKNCATNKKERDIIKGTKEEPEGQGEMKMQD